MGEKRRRGAARPCGFSEAGSRRTADGERSRVAEDGDTGYPLRPAQSCLGEEITVFTTIVVGVDGREGGRDALALGEHLRRAFGGELFAVHAYSYDFFVSRGASPDFESVMHANANDLVVGELERTGVSAHPVAMADDSPGRALHAAANWHESDVIVVGSDHRGPLGRVLAGDVTAGTLHGALCPVVVAPRGYAEHGSGFRAIGVGYDGSVESRAAAELARDLAVAAGARLRVLRVLEPPVPGGAGLAYDRDWQEDAEAVREHVQAELDELLAELGDVASGEVVVGDPVRELGYDANELDLLVIGSRGYGPVRRVMLGSTSSKLVHQAPCPVLVLTRGAVDETSGRIEASASDAAAPA
jgi:nucleotide-binding universal stress UspA family protein